MISLSMFSKLIAESVFKKKANEERLGNKKNKLSESTFLKPIKRINNQGLQTSLLTPQHEDSGSSVR